jgi:hypothetical protein
MDLQIRLWDEIEGQAVTRYLNSRFLYRPNANNIAALIQEEADAIDQTKSIGPSMDGPRVNFAVLNIINENRVRKDMAELYDIGSCSLHSVHLALKTGFKEVKETWSINKVLSAMHNLFKDSPKRRDMYIAAYRQPEDGESEKFPLPFHSVRWADNVRPARRITEGDGAVWVAIKKVIREFEEGTASSIPKNASYSTLKRQVSEPLLLARVMFFQDLAEIFEVFLVDFQSDAPLFPFLCTEIDGIIRRIVKIIFIREVVDGKTRVQICKPGAFNATDEIPDIDIKLPTRTQRLLATLKGLNDEKRLKFCFIILCFF